MSNKLNETFQKHLKLLHEHLNINEYSDEYSDAKKLSIREDESKRRDGKAERANYYNLLKAGKIPEKQALKVEELLNYHDDYMLDGYLDQTVQLYAPPNHGNIQDQPRFGNVVLIDKDGRLIDQPH